jgi:hypothetical protein
LSTPASLFKAAGSIIFFPAPEKKDRLIRLAA